MKKQKLYKIWMEDGSRVPMTYDEVCEKLGFDSRCHFIEITSWGTITFTLGKPHEIKYLRHTCWENGIRMAKSLKNIRL